jgi:hypothetical protein
MTSQSDQPWYQELPPCPWYPDQVCRGECQYILAAEACAHEPAGAARLRDLGLVREAVAPERAA